MTRKIKSRQVDFMPNVTYFKPRGVPLSSLKDVVVTIDELEALRLVDQQKLTQTKAAKKMKISQSTLGRIIQRAHQKIATALTGGQAIKIEGGTYTMLNNPQNTNNQPGRGLGQGLGRGLGRGLGQGLGRGLGRSSSQTNFTGGRGRMGGPLAGGPGGNCICTNQDCHYEMPHQVGIACNTLKCPQCGSLMTRKAA